MNAKHSRQRFWHCQRKGHKKTIPMITPHQNLHVFGAGFISLMIQFSFNSNTKSFVFAVIRKPVGLQYIGRHLWILKFESFKFNPILLAFYNQGSGNTWGFFYKLTIKVWRQLILMVSIVQGPLRLARHT